MDSNLVYVSSKAVRIACRNEIGPDYETQLRRYETTKNPKDRIFENVSGVLVIEICRGEKEFCRLDKLRAIVDGLNARSKTKGYTCRSLQADPDFPSASMLVDRIHNVLSTTFTEGDSLYYREASALRCLGELDDIYALCFRAADSFRALELAAPKEEKLLKRLGIGIKLLCARAASCYASFDLPQRLERLNNLVKLGLGITGYSIFRDTAEDRFVNALLGFQGLIGAHQYHFWIDQLVLDAEHRPFCSLQFQRSIQEARTALMLADAAPSEELCFVELKKIREELAEAALCLAIMCLRSQAPLIDKSLMSELRVRTKRRLAIELFKLAWRMADEAGSNTCKASILMWLGTYERHHSLSSRSIFSEITGNAPFDRSRELLSFTFGKTGSHLMAVLAIHEARARNSRHKTPKPLDELMNASDWEYVMHVNRTTPFAYSDGVRFHVENIA